MALDQKKFEHKHTAILRDVRPLSKRLSDWGQKPANAFGMFFIGAAGLAIPQLRIHTAAFADLIFLLYIIYFIWLYTRDRSLIFKMPMGAKWKDANNCGPGKNGKPEGILYVGNTKDTNEEVWFTNSDARTHILYLGTTGAGKTEGLKSMVTNAMSWSSGFVYVDGKADTDLWSSLSSLVRRFGRDDDLLVLNYMTGNSDVKAPSNTMNPFSSGSASYLTQMLVSLMPEAEGDNAMWKERAVALASSLMPALTWKRDNQDLPLSVSTIREYMNLNNVIKVSRDEILPEKIREGLKGYLDTLPGYVDDAFDDEGREKPMGPDQPMVDTTTCRQQHGYLAMQFTRSLQSLGDEYGYIFDTQAADVDMVDVVLNRRILIVLIPALEKSSDEIANLGKIVAATLKGMMGSTLGSTVEGESSTVIENKPTTSATPFMTVFDEVGYYTAQGMAVMAAQARSLGFCLIYSSQDLAAMEKKVKEEARSITGNCNLKIFGKLEDPMQTKEFFEKTVGSALVTEVSSFSSADSSLTRSYSDTHQAGVQTRARASYDDLRSFREGQAIITFGDKVVEGRIFFSNPGFAKAMRVTRFISLPPPEETLSRNARVIQDLRDLMVKKNWTPEKADVAADTPAEIAAMRDTFEEVYAMGKAPLMAGISALVGIHGLSNPITIEEPQDLAQTTQESQSGGQSDTQQGGQASGGGQKPAQKPPAQQTQAQQSPAQQPQQPPAQPPADQNPAEDQAPPAATGNPMAFFAKKSPADMDTKASPKEDVQQPAAEQPQEQPAQQTEEQAPEAPEEQGAKDKQGPVSWSDISQSSTPGKGAAQQVLDRDTQKILQNAASSAGKSLIKGNGGNGGGPDDSGHTEAAE